ncbi:hypothetical protein ACEPAF_35 [Sanghuangporus sanghuang]
MQNSSFPVPSILKGIDEVPVEDIQSWIRHSKLLRLDYKTANKSLSVCEIGIRPGLRVTWLKLTHARWCIIAAAGEDESELSLWEIESHTIKSDWSRGYTWMHL